MSDEELDALDRMAREADERDGDPDLEDCDTEDGADDYRQELRWWSDDTTVPAHWRDCEDFEESEYPAEIWGEPEINS